MSKDWKYILYLGGLAGLLALLLLSKDKQYDWRVTLAYQDKNPYGTFALNELLLARQKVLHNYKTFYELKDSLRENETVFLIAQNFYPDHEDSKAMMNHVYQGGVIFISANYIYSKLADSLGIEAHDSFGLNSFSREDSTSLKLSNSKLDTMQLFFYKNDNIHCYFMQRDTIHSTKKSAPATVIAKNYNDHAVAVKVNHGKGYFIFNSTPMIFTNIYLLSRNNYKFASALLSYLPQKKIYRSEFYQLGRQEARTPLRFILTTEPLRWAYYIVIISILMFIIFEAKRKQRIIPVVKQVKNTTLEFVGTIGSLYYENSDHKSIAMKKILFFNEMLRTKLNFSMSTQSDHYVHALALKAGVDEAIVSRLVGFIRYIQSTDIVDADDLLTLNERIQEFLKK